MPKNSFFMIISLIRVGRNFLRLRLILVYKNFGVLFMMAKVGIFFELCKGCVNFIFVVWIVGVRFV